MSFLNPAAFLFLLSIPVIILFHLLKIRRREAVVSSTLLWPSAIRDREATAPFRRLRLNLLLLLQILILLLLTLVLARPWRSVLTRGHERSILILDASASMQAVDVPGGRFAAAKRQALDLINGLRPGQQAMVIEAGAETRVLAALTADKAVLRRAVAAGHAQDAPTNLTEAMRLAQAQVRAAGSAVIHVFTDGAFETPRLPDLGSAALRWHRFGVRGRNVGMTAFEVRKAHYGSFDYQLFLALANFAAEPMEFTLRISLDRALLKEERVRLGPEVRRSFIVPFTYSGGGVVRAEIDIDDDLDADDRAYAVLPEPRKIRALLMGQGNAFLEKALAADPQVAFEVKRPGEPADLGAYDVVILDGYAPQRIPAGKYLLINALPKNVPLEATGRIQDPTILDWDRTHPVMRYLDMGSLIIQEAWRVRPMTGGRALLESNLTPLIYILETGRLKVLFVGFDLYRTDFPLRVAFPLFVSNALRWLQPVRLEDAGLQLHPGQALHATLPGGASEAVLLDPRGGTRRVRADAEGRVTVPGLERVGVYTLKAGPWERRFAVNLLDEAGSATLPRADLRDQGSAGEGMTFEARQELWRLFLLLALLTVLLEAAVYLRQVSGRWPAPALAVRLAVAVAGVAALARPGWLWPVDRMQTYFLLDLSDSIPLEERLRGERYIQEATARMRKDDRAGIIAFGAEPVLASPLQAGPPLASLPEVNGRATDIGAAVKLALASFPAEGARRIVLLSDGNENRGDALEAAQLAQTQGVEIFTVPLAPPRGGEVLLERMTVPQEVKHGEPFLVRVVAWAAQKTEGRLSLFRDGTFVGSQKVHLEPGKNVFAYQQSLDEGGFHLFQARIEAPDDLVEENNRATALVAVRGRPQVLYVEKDRNQGRYLIDALKPQNIAVEMVGPEGLPTTMEGLLHYDTVILSNVSALRVSKEQMELVRSYVRDQGGGLIMLGGEESFGVGGYYHSPVEEALPVTMETRQKVEVPSLAVVLVLDRSGSMETATQGGRFTRLDLAKEAAQLVVELLDERNEVGVLSFDTAGVWDVPMGPAKDKDRILRQIASIKAGGGTDVFVAMKEAYEAIFDRRAVLKHVIVLSDGETPDANFAGLVRRMVQDKITVSSVAIGTDAGIQLMTDISRWGRGRFYYTDDIYTIPRIFTLETQLASKAAIIEQPFRPVVSHPYHETLKDIDWDSVPPLGGYVGTTAKPTADTLLISNQRDPILAVWRFGLGRSAAFTSDFKAKWGVLWLRWEGFGKLLAQMVRWTLRTTTRGEVVTTVEPRGDRGEITLEAVDQQGEFINFLEAQAGVVFPDKSRRVVPLEQVGPGRYRGDFEAADQGAYLVGVIERKDQKTVGSEVASLVVPYSPEHRVLAANTDLLRMLAGVTGGTELRSPAEVFGLHRRKGRARVELWPWLTGLMLCLFVPDVALRRLRLFRGGGRLGGSSGGAGGVGRGTVRVAAGRRRW